jgi:tetratricopeptide (TPR) repeat protein
VLLAALAVRAVWPLADPAEHLSWSSGEYTDPASITHAARNAVLFGEWVRDESRDLAFYPLFNGITWAAYRAFGASRLTAQALAAVLGTLTVLAVYAAVRRGRGTGAALLVAAALAASFWLAMFSRVPLAENPTTALVAAACAAACGRGSRWLFAAGFLAGAAAFFGKVHAAAFTPALVAFVVARDRRAAACLPVAAGWIVAAAAWGVLVARPFRAEILDQIGRSAELYGTPPLLRSPIAAAEELLWTLRASWLFHRTPVLGALGGLFVVGTLLDGELRRRRLQDGTALLAAWFVAAWALLTLLPYKAPRHFVPAAVPLLAAGACLLGEAARGERVAGGRRVLLTWLALGALVAVDVATHALALVDRRLGGALGSAALDAMMALRPWPAHLGWAAAILAAALWAVFAPPLSLAARIVAVPRRKLALRLGAAALLVEGAQFGAWATHRTYAIEEAKESLDAIVGEDAVLYGTFAPLLVQDTRRVGVPEFGAVEAGAVERYGVTHVVFGSPEEQVQFDHANPALAERLTPVRRWPLRARHVRAVELHRVTGTAYLPTPFERAVEELEAGRPEQALALLEQHRRSGGTIGADHLAAEGRAWFALGDLTRSRARLVEAVALSPADPGHWFHLGLVAARAGEATLAREAWTRARRLDPYDPEIGEALRQLEGSGSAGP